MRSKHYLFTGHPPPPPPDEPQAPGPNKSTIIMINESTDIKNEAFKLPSQLVINQEFNKSTIIMINESTDIKNEAFKLPSQLVINQEFGTIPSKEVNRVIKQMSIGESNQPLCYPY
jgi:hypothetical protein